MFNDPTSPAAVPDVTALAQRLVKWRELADAWTDACEDVFDAAVAAGDEFPALAWMLAERGHGIGAEFGFAIDDLAALLALVEQTRQERDEWKARWESMSDARSERAERERDEAVAHARGLREALETLHSPSKRLLIDQGQGITAFIRAALVVAGGS